MDLVENDFRRLCSYQHWLLAHAGDGVEHCCFLELVATFFLPPALTSFLLPALSLTTLTVNMRACTALLFVAAAVLVRAQIDGDTGPDNATTPADTTGEITIHKITVGRVTNSFQPNSIQAKPGDVGMLVFGVL